MVQTTWYKVASDGELPKLWQINIEKAPKGWNDFLSFSGVFFIGLGTILHQGVMMYWRCSVTLLTQAGNQTL